MRRAVALLLLAGLVAIPGTSWAQDVDETGASGTPVESDQQESEENTPRWAKEPWEKIRFGIKAGASWATLSGELPIPDVGTFSFDGDYGFAAGLSFEVPLSHVLNLSNWTEHEVFWRGNMRHYLEMDWQEFRIWGVTAAIIANLSRRIAVEELLDG